MKNFIYYCFTLIICLQVNAQESQQNKTPTELYLLDHSEDEIVHSLGTNKATPYLSFFRDIISQEKEDGFFGYHGCSQKYRIFQDILRAVFEETLKYKIPKDFQFLRIPGDPLFNLKNNKKSYYGLFDRKPASKELKDFIINGLILTPFNKAFSTNILLTNLTKNEREQFWKISLSFIEILDTLAKEDYYSYQNDDLFITKDLFFTADQQDPNKDPNATYMKSVQKKLKLIQRHLESKKKEEMSFLTKALKTNKSADVAYQVFSRVAPKDKFATKDPEIKLWLKKKISFEGLFYHLQEFPYKTEIKYWLFFFPYDDTAPGQQSRILCINVPLYGNYHRPDESSASVFLYGYSIEGGESSVISYLTTFFEEIGLDKDLPKTLYAIGTTELKSADNKNGCLLQFFDRSISKSLPPYHGLDRTTFVSHSFGIPVKALAPSLLALDLHPIRHNTMDLQLRLITSTYTTLNPYSFLRIKRYDTTPHISETIIQKMRETLKESPIDKKKINAYKKKINNIWKQNNLDKIKL